MQKHRFWKGASESEWQEACRLRSLASAIQGYLPGIITALGLLAPVQPSPSKLLLRKYRYPKSSLPSSAPHHSRYFSHTLSNARGRLRPIVE
jgi:hypothetical protein